MPCARPVTVVAPVTAAVTEGPTPPMVIDVRLTASTRPDRAIRSCADRAVATADAPGVAPATPLAGVLLITKSPTAAAATAATVTATQAENPGMPR